MSATGHNLDYKTVNRDFPSRDLVIEWMILNQLGRRNLSNYDRSLLALKLKPIVELRAKENLKTSTGGSNPQPLQKSEKAEPINTNKEIAKRFGVSHNLIRNELHYIDRGDYLKRRKEIYELKHPETKRGAINQYTKDLLTADNAVSTFAKDTASKTNLSDRTIRQDIQIAENLTEEVKNLIKESNLNKTDTINLLKIEPEKQKKIIETAINNDIPVKEAIKSIKNEERKADIMPNLNKITM